jgi:hypothetical protein|tara:strand:- start:3150 stop:3383 length:234 start_codon:yes stop_codon:yes gene_type:complete
MPTYVQIYKCVRCRHKWIPRKRIKPKKCPKCKNPWETKGRGLGWRKGISNKCVIDADASKENLYTKQTEVLTAESVQ